MDEPSKIRQNLMRADIDPEALLEGEIPRLIDEWQLASKIDTGKMKAVIYIHG